MPCSIDVSGKSALVWGKSGVMGVNGGKVDLEGNGEEWRRERCSRNVLYERRINKSFFKKDC